VHDRLWVGEAVVLTTCAMINGSYPGVYFDLGLLIFSWILSVWTIDSFPLLSGSWTATGSRSAYSG
jgi:hypothetical protein